MPPPGADVLPVQPAIPLGPELDMATDLGRWELLRSWLQAYRLLVVMNAQVADLPTRLTPYGVVDRGDGR